MSFKMDVANVVTTLVEGMLPRGSDDKKLLYVILEIEVKKSKSSGYGIQKFVHLLFHRPNNYTKVMWNVTDNPLMRKGDFQEWKVTSCHDSCWKSDGVESPLTNLYFKMCDGVDPAARPIDLCATAQFSVWHEPKIVEVNGYTHDRENFKFTVQWK